MANLKNSYLLVGVAVVVGLFLFVGGFFYFRGESDSDVQGAIQRGEQVFEDGAKIGDNTLLTIQKKIPVGTDELTLFNNQGYGKKFVVEDTYLSWDSGRASTSIRVNVFATSSNKTILSTQDFSEMGFSATSTLMRLKIATSTPNALAAVVGYNSTTTSSRELARTKTFDGTTAFGRTQMVVDVDEKLVFYTQQGELLSSCGGGAEGGQCESATSTNQRTITFDVVVKGFFRE